MKKIQIEVEVPDFLSNGFIKALTMLSDEELMLVKVYTAGLLASKTGENFEPLMEEIIGNIKIKTQKGKGNMLREKAGNGIRISVRIGIRRRDSDSGSLGKFRAEK